MKKLSKILVLLILAALLFSCSGSGGGSGLSNLFNNNSSHNYSFAGRNFGFKTGNPATEVLFVFTDATNVKHTYNGVEHAGTYTDPNSKTGTLKITYTDTSIPVYEKQYTFADDGHSFNMDGKPFTFY